MIRNFRNYTIQLRKDGRYTARVTDQGHVHCFYGKTKKEVQQKLEVFIDELNRYQFSHIASHLRYKVPRKRYGYLYDLKNTWACQRKDYRRCLLTYDSAASKGVP